MADDFVLVLRARDAEPRSTWVHDRRNIVLLHGWLQDHRSWLGVAKRLRRRYGHDVMLIDFLAHGRSPPPANPADLSPEALVQQVRRNVLRLGWDRATCSRALTLGGCSLGGAVAMLFTNRWPEDVDRLVLVAPAGFPEPWYNLPVHVGRAVASRLAELYRARKNVYACPLLGPLVPHAHIVQNTPRYGNEDNWFVTKAARSLSHILLVCAAYDELHRADAWAVDRFRQDRNGFRMLIFQMSHAMLCTSLASLGLEGQKNAWHGPDEAARHVPGRHIPAPPPEPRARL